MKKSLIALAFGTLALGMSEFVMMGILPDIARSLGVSIPEAGHLISAYALGVCFGAPLMVLVARKRPLKQILLALTAMIAAGNLRFAGSRLLVAAGFAFRFGTSPRRILRCGVDRRRAGRRRREAYGSRVDHDRRHDRRQSVRRAAGNLYQQRPDVARHVRNRGRVGRCGAAAGAVVGAAHGTAARYGAERPVSFSAQSRAVARAVVGDAGQRRHFSAGTVTSAR